MTDPTPPVSSASRMRRLEIFVAVLWVAAVIAATIQQGITHPNNNFLIFRAASQHLLHGQDLYAAYPAPDSAVLTEAPSGALDYDARHLRRRVAKVGNFT